MIFHLYLLLLLFCLMYYVAHLLIHSLRQLLASGCLPLFTSDGLHLYFYGLTAHFGQWLQGGSSGANSTAVAGGGGLDVQPGEKKLSAAQAGAVHARDAPWNKRSSQGRWASDWASLDG